MEIFKTALAGILLLLFVIFIVALICIPFIGVYLIYAGLIEEDIMKAALGGLLIAAGVGVSKK